MADLVDLTMHELRDAFSEGRASCVEATRACLQRAEQTSSLGAFLTLDPEGALAAAERSDQRRAAKETLGDLDGVPVAFKDIFLTEGIETTCASQILAGFEPPYTGTAVRRLLQAGAVMLGKLNMDEFAMGSSTEHSAFAIAKNPWLHTRAPGGSSGGSAAAVAIGSAYGTLGTDTGGSIRQPASFCGVVGLKPTYGRVSRYGVIAFASSLDQVGPFGRNVTDCALQLQAIAGHDPRDSTCANVPSPDYLAELDAGVSGMRLGVPREYFVQGIAPAVREAVDAAIEVYRRLGAEIVEVSLPHTEYAIATYYLICTAEASSNLARYDGVRYGLREGGDAGLREMYRRTRGRGFGAEVKRRIMLGTYALSAGYYDAYYGKAQKVRTLIRRDFERAFDDVDALITPTTPTTAFELGQNLDDPIEMYLADIFTVGCNLAGLPGLSLPCGFDGDGLPIGLQIVAAPWRESTLLTVARAYEREHDWHARRPCIGES